MRRNWTKEETILAFNLYCKLPYGQFNDRNAEVKRLAQLLGRTPGAVAYKLVNFVSIDPKQALLGRVGATNSSRTDKDVFNEFKNDFDNMFLLSERLLALKIKQGEIQSDTEIKFDEGKIGKDKIVKSKARLNQDYFRSMVLSNYSNICAITKISIPELLIASHIKPWSVDKKNRLNPKNGICLSSTFDRAFDRGLISITPDYIIVLSNKLKQYHKEPFFTNHFKPFDNSKLNLPKKFLPEVEFLEYHNREVFIS